MESTSMSLIRIAGNNTEEVSPLGDQWRLLLPVRVTAVRAQPVAIIKKEEIDIMIVRAQKVLDEILAMWVGKRGSFCAAVGIVPPSCTRAGN